ncbi:MAG: FAD binding domain-containing protein, partial [Longimicrobiales bacterium]
MLSDAMTGFELLQPTTIDDAVELLDRHGREGWVLAGGYDSLDWFKDRVKQPTAVIDLEGVKELRGVRSVGGGIEIGAMTTLTEVERNDSIRSRYRLLAAA